MHDAQTGYLDTVYSTKNTTVVQDLDYLFDSLGNVKQRVDQFQTLTENFTYDNLNRVTQIDTILDPSTTNTVTMVYDALGNITNKTDVGAYTYGQAHVACASGVAGPHAVTTIAGTKNATYCYDANGNMVTGDGRTVTYSAFDKPTLIVKGTNSVAITYGPDRARFKRVDVATSGTTTTHYVGAKAYEEIFKPGGTIERKHYIGDFAVVTETELTSQAPTVQTDYLLRDHLGSLDVITDELGAVVTKLSFDAWGKRRESNWTPMADPTLFASVVTTRGFTGHEQLDSVGLVHMNGRVYDAEIGRFLSADPNIQDVENLQSWNRYTYVLNNPLSFTDPDGFFFKKIFKAIGKAFGKVFNFLKKNFKAILRIAITATACALGGPAGCALASVGTSFAFNLVDGGSIGDALKAAAFAAVTVGASIATGGLFDGASLLVEAVGTGLVRGVVSGALTIAQGGSFLQGFASAAISAAVGVAVPYSGVGSTIVAAVAGGISAELTGGKFENGALTAAFAHVAYGSLRQATTQRFTQTRIQTFGAGEGVLSGRFGAALGAAGVAAMMDGPILPIGDLFGLILLIGTYLTEDSGVDKLYRYGSSIERTNDLASQAAAAEKQIGYHGVSTRTVLPEGKPSRVATVDEVIRHFDVVKTGNDPYHFTVVLPKPVTPETTKIFNSLFKKVR